MISAIRWVSELVEIAGGEDVFGARSHAPEASGRTVSGADVIAAAPDLIIGSWCGKKFAPAKVGARRGFAAIPAVRNQALFEIKSSVILQPGPAALTDGLDLLRRHIAAVAFDRDADSAERAAHDPIREFHPQEG